MLPGGWGSSFLMMVVVVLVVVVVAASPSGDARKTCVVVKEGVSVNVCAWGCCVCPKMWDG